MLRIGVWINDDYTPSVGGGFSYYNKLITHIDNYTFDHNLEIVFVSTKQTERLNKRKIVIGKIGFAANLLYKLIRRMPYSKLRYTLIDKLFQNKTRTLLKEKVDILYYPIQAQQHIPHYPFIATNWDIAHLTTYPFPEFLKDDDFFRRDTWYRTHISQALMIFVESEAGKNEFINLMNFDEQRVKVVPLFASNTTEIQVSDNEDLLSGWGLSKQQYFFYPAQFWAHKNHYNLISAFKNVEKKFPSLKLVLTGSDKGNLHYIKQLVNELQLSLKVLFLGFVSDRDLSILYSNALALVMPSLLGPTNMPLLEARELNCPVLCSKHKGHMEMLKDGALYFDPLNIDDIAYNMGIITDPEFRTTLLEKAASNKKESIFKISTTLEKMEEHFLELMAVRKTWE